MSLPPSIPDKERPTRSLAVNSSARLLSNVGYVVAGVASSAITARFLGPSGKGTLSTLLYVVVLIASISSMGLGEAAIVLRGKKMATYAEALGGSLLPVVAASIAGGSLFGVAVFLFDWKQAQAVLVPMVLLIVFRALVHTLISLHNAKERLVLTSSVIVIQLAGEVLGLIAFIVVLDLGILGGVAAALGGAVIALVLLIKAAAERPRAFRPGLDLSYLTKATRIGVVIQGSQIVTLLAQRADLVLVYGWLGGAPAGRYSVALTIGQIAAYAAGSLSIAAFPRLAGLSVADAAALIPRISRMALILSLLSASLIALFVPWGLVLLFGGDFGGAVTPTLILLFGAVLWGQVMIFGRAAASRGDVAVLFRAFAGTLLAMLLLDLILIPLLGINGAAVASVGGPVGGLWVALRWYRRQPWHSSPRAFVPSTAELRDLQTLLVAFLRRRPDRDRVPLES